MASRPTDLFRPETVRISFVDRAARISTMVVWTVLAAVLMEQMLFQSGTLMHAGLATVMLEFAAR